MQLKTDGPFRTGRNGIHSFTADTGGHQGHPGRAQRHPPHAGNGDPAQANHNIDEDYLSKAAPDRLMPGRQWISTALSLHAMCLLGAYRSGPARPRGPGRSNHAGQVQCDSRRGDHQVGRQCGRCRGSRRLCTGRHLPEAGNIGGGGFMLSYMGVRPRSSIFASAPRWRPTATCTSTKPATLSRPKPRAAAWPPVCRAPCAGCGQPTSAMAPCHGKRCYSPPSSWPTGALP